MTMLSPDFAPALAEIVLGLGICLLLLVDLWVPDRARDISYIVALLVLAATAWAVGESATLGQAVIFDGSYISDTLAHFMKLIGLAGLATVFLYSRAYLRDRGLHRGEYYLLGLFAMLGIMVMISAYSLLTLYLGLEMLSLSLYGLVAIDRNSPIAAEAAMKYFVLGAIASGCLLYGVSILYGLTGTVQLNELAEALSAAAEGSRLAAVVGMAFIIVGLAFKFGAVPFHMWLPDVYEGAPTSVTLFVSTVPKLAAFALALRVIVDGLAPLAVSGEAILGILAVLSLGIGNVLAIAQTNIKRMLGYSTISHVGFILLGFAAGNDAGVEAALFYTVIYMLMAAGAFGIVILLGRGDDEADQLDDLRGLNQRSPWFAGMMLLLMVSMIGVPPLAGFYAKWWVLSALIDADKMWLVLAGILFSVVGAFYYLRIIKLMYFDAPAAAVANLRPGADLRFILSLNSLLVLALGLFPDTLIELCSRALG